MEVSTSMDASDQDPASASNLLIKGAVQSQTVEDFLTTMGAMLWSSPLRVQRVFLSLHTLHPAFRARTYLWRQRTPRVSVIEWPHGLKNRPGYYDSPDFRVHSSGREFRVENLRGIVEHPCDLYGKLGAQGYTDYLMLPVPFGDGTMNTISIATKAASGFPVEDLDRFRNLSNILVLILERYAALETVNSALDTYLGRSVAREILSGHVRAGYGEEIEAAILFADLHDFTAHAARLDPVGTVRLLNEYFDCLVGPIEEHGGYVLKFIGDAVLAFFPILRAGDEPVPLKSVLTIRGRLKQLNRLRQVDGLPQLRHALCVHFGRVLYGNVGSTERLDFTIIGEAVNVAARCVAAGKPLGSDYIFTGAFVDRFGGFGDAGLIHLGPLALRGVAEPLELFTLSAEASA